MTNESEPRAWDVLHARFNYDGSRGYKYRPVIVLDANDQSWLVMMVTSATNALALEHDVPILDWREAGLHKPSIARADRIASIPPHYKGSAGRIGTLTLRDISRILHVLREM